MVLELEDVVAGEKLFSGVLDPNDISLRAWLQRYWFAVLPALLAGGSGSLVLMFRMLPAGLVSRLRLRTVVAPVLAVALVENVLRLFMHGIF